MMVHIPTKSIRTNLPREIVAPQCYKRLHDLRTHSTKTDTRPRPTKGNSPTSFLQQAAVKVTQANNADKRNHPTMGNSLTSLLQQATLPRTHCNNTDTRPHPNKEIVSAHGYKRLQYQMAHSNNTDTRAHRKEGHSLSSLLQQAAVPTESC